MLLAIYLFIALITIMVFRAIGTETDRLEGIFFDEVAEWVFPILAGLFWPIILAAAIVFFLLLKPLDSACRYIVREVTKPRENIK
jgi:hypothetical protein